MKKSRTSPPSLFIEDLARVTGGTGSVTTMALGEEGPDLVTTMAVGEEGPDLITSVGLGEH